MLSSVTAIPFCIVSDVFISGEDLTVDKRFKMGVSSANALFAIIARENSALFDRWWKDQS